MVLAADFKSFVHPSGRSVIFHVRSITGLPDGCMEHLFKDALNHQAPHVKYTADLRCCKLWSHLREQNCKLRCKSGLSGAQTTALSLV